MKIGFWELVVIVVVAFVFIGPDQLPVYAQKLGKMLRELKKYTGAASEEIQKNVVEPLNEIQAPLKEAVAPLTDIKKDIDNSVKDVTKSFTGIGKTSKEEAAKAEQAEEVRLLAADLRDSVASQGDNLDFSPAEREMVEQRLDEIYRLKQKYGGTIPEILAYLEKITAELDTLENADDRREELREQYRGMLAEAKGIAAELTEQRRKAAKQLEGEIVRELSELDMDKVKMRVAVRTGTKLSAHGCDTVTFEISVNPGEPEKPLSKVASGGELSRIMLALKNVLTAGEDVGMLIFDEIDTGVSGHAAQQIGRKLSAIAKKKQTLCVTHLPQIAAMGDHHLRISKSVRDGRSYTDVSPMDRAHRVDEIARLLSGEEISDAARRNAEELLDAAGQGA